MQKQPENINTPYNTVGTQHDPFSEILTELGRVSCLQHEMNQRNEAIIQNQRAVILSLERRSDRCTVRISALEKEVFDMKNTIRNVLALAAAALITTLAFGIFLI